MANNVQRAYPPKRNQNTVCIGTYKALEHTNQLALVASLIGQEIQSFRFLSWVHISI
ncbi:hypothetical protein UFOVP602_7 [uncultured Caudovirales phage]|uniref:Uncharacterized protein n=1 Tax=uncultured Caudovirales phage TaxID=2100421 RepID=A0A6J5NA27_9CAUD|nr:hypothetical protein UFOVP602_7 [uncultured Caudovirales phage]